MQSLLIAPSTVDLRVLRDLLSQQNVSVLSTSDLGAGVGLAQVDFDGFDCGIAVIPSAQSDRLAGMPAMYVEIGIAVGRGLPLLVITEPPDPPSAGLSGLTTVSAMSDNAEVLRLHLGFFLHSVRSKSARRPSVPHLDTTSVGTASYRSRVETLRTGPAHERGFAFEQLVLDLFREGGAVLEERGGTQPDQGVDVAAFLPGEESSLGTVVLQLKSTPRYRQRVLEKLSQYVLTSRSGLGLLIYLGETVHSDVERLPPLTASLSIDELLDQLDNYSLSDVLKQARNRAVHGM